MRFSVLLNTFNRAHFLPYVLAAWSRLDPEQFEMIVADDGSEDGTGDLLRELAPQLPYSLQHVYHPNDGHRRAEILNKAVHVAREEAMLFTDADTMPARDLLDVYAEHFASHRLVFGGYMRLTPKYTESFVVEKALSGEYEHQLTAEIRRKLNAQHRKHKLYELVRKKGRPHIMGLNMCIPRSGFVKVNGYDNEFRGWGRADGNLRERLKRVGVRPFSIWNKAVVFHLHHDLDPTKKLRANDEYARRNRIPTAPENGFAQVAPEVTFASRA